MISLTTTVSGEQLGNELASDPEELAYVLLALAQRMDGDDMKELGDYINFSNDEMSKLQSWVVELKEICV